MLRFDTNIPFTPTEHLYWNKFPYRVLVANPGLSYRWGEKTFASRFIINAASRKQYDKEVQCLYRLRRYLAKTLASNDDSIRINSMGWSVYCYFERAEDVQKFIDEHDKNLVIIREIMGPNSSEDLATLHDIPNVILRDQLFHGRFGWRIKFKHDSQHQKESFVKWYTSYFDKDYERAYLQNTNKVCILFLRDEDDVFITKLASGHIRKIEQVKLLNKNKNKESSLENESILVQEVGREEVIGGGH